MREEAIREMLRRASEFFGDKSFQSVPFDLNDRGSGDKGFYSMAYDSMRPEMRDFCGPDWTFVHWAECGIESFEKTRDEMMLSGSLRPKFRKAAWFGNVNSPSSEVPEHSTRPMLLKIAEKNPDIMEARHVGRATAGSHGYISMPEMVRQYGILMDIGGNGYSGRVKWLLFSNRVLIMIERRYLEYFSQDLVPWVHYVPANQDLSDLTDKILWILDNSDRAEQIAGNALEFAMKNFSEVKVLDRVRAVCNNVNSFRSRSPTSH